MQAVLFIPVLRVHLVCSAEVFSKNTEAFKPVISKNDLTICHLRMISVSASVLYMNLMTQRECVRVRACVRE